MYNQAIRELNPGGFILKNNQFAHITISGSQKITELRSIGYLTPEILAKRTLAKTWRELVIRAFPQALTISSQTEKLASLLADENTDLLTYINQGNFSVTAFYNVALQLLEFLPEIDFSFSNPIEAMEKINLPYITNISTTDTLLSAWYDLLCTHTKNGQLLIDVLATNGFFVKFYGKVTQPLFFNGKALPVFNTDKLIREVVYVESTLDTDKDGKLDLLKVEIIRPSETNTGLKIPALYTASPYNQGTNDEDGDKLMHPMNVPLSHKIPNNTTYDEIAYHSSPSPLPNPRVPAGITKEASETFSREFSYTLNDYFLARGFAAVYAAGIGTMDSGGVRTCGSEDETASTVAIIEWLNGQRRAFTNKTDNIQIEAWWCNNAIAMTGRSYLGTLATAAATTGVAGLKTIISEAAISSWYDYYRDGGLVVAPCGFPGEDADVLALECFSRKKQAGDYLSVKEFFSKQLQKITAEQDRTTGNYNSFWDARNYLKNIKGIKADIVMVHGLNDWNVKPRNVYQLWNSLKELPIKQKLILHQGQHIYVNNFRSLDFTDMMNLWLSYKLYNVPNNAAEVLPDILVQDNLQVETWHSHKDWDSNEPAQNLLLQQHELVPENSELQEGAANFQDHLNEEDFSLYSTNHALWKEHLLQVENSPLKNNRLIFKSALFEEEMLLQGAPEVTVNVSTNKDHGLLSFMLVDYGNKKRFKPVPTTLARKALNLGYHWREDDLTEFTLDKETPWKMISVGHINLQNRTSLWKNDELLPNTFYPVSVKLQPTFYKIPKDHQLGLIIYATDMRMTVRGNEEQSYSIQLAESKLALHLAKKAGSKK